MNAPAEEADLVATLSRAFPSLAGLEPQESWKRVEGLGVYAASLWTAGQAGLKQWGVALPTDVFEALAGDAARATKARRNGVAFLVRVRSALQDDTRFGPLVATIAQHWTRANQIRPAGAATKLQIDARAIVQETLGYEAPRSGAAPAPTPGSSRYEVAGYEILLQLGEGATGKVWKARQKSLDRFVALKVLSPHLANDEDFVRRFDREGRAAAKLEHPNIVRVFDQGQDQVTGFRYIAYEFIDGQTLQEVLKAREKLPEREGLAHGRGIAEALAAAEKAGIVHRDVKPANIIIARDGVSKLVDLGLAKKTDDKALTASVNYIMGTPAFISPEVALGQDADTRSDLYSLGMTLFRAVTGRLAHEGNSPGVLFRKHTTEDCADPRTVEPSLSEGAARVILKLCARKPEDRYQTANDAARDLDLVLSGKPPLLGAPVSFAAPPRPGFSGGVIPDDPPWTLELRPASVPDAATAPQAPADPAEAMLRALERSGDPEELGRAIERFQQMIAESGDDVSVSARSEAALARAYLLRGDRANADGRALAALEKDPRCRAAVEVLWRGLRGDSERYRLELGLAHVAGAIVHGKLDMARRFAERLRESFVQEPQPLLALAVIARLAGSEADFVDGLRRAWALFPSKERGDVTLGGLDGLAADVLAAHGRGVYRGDGSLIKATLEGLDDKANLVAGALRMAIGVARVALERGNLTLFEQRRLHFAMARALSGLRRYDAAADELARAGQFKPSEVELAAIEAEKTFLTYMKHMLDAQGAPRPKEARHRCLGAQSLVALAQVRAGQASKERAARVFEIEKVGLAVVALSQKDKAARADIRRAAERLGQGDPFETIEPAEKDLADISAERASDADRPKSETARGFLGKLKNVANAAAQGVAGAAREAQLLLRETQARGRYDAAVRRFAPGYARDLARPDPRNAELHALARRAAALDTQAAVFSEEEQRARKDVERLAPYV